MGSITLVGGGTLAFTAFGDFILIYNFPIELNFHKIQLLIPKSSRPIRIRVTDLNR